MYFFNQVFYPTPSMYNSSLKTTPSPWKTFTDKKWAIKKYKMIEPPMDVTSFTKSFSVHLVRPSLYLPGSFEPAGYL